MFGVEQGRIQFGYDYASLEARVQGTFIYPYTDGPALAESLVAERPNDCFDKETKILTKDGWIHSDDITEDTLIANWSSNPFKFITYAKPSNIIRRQHIGKMVRVLNTKLDIKVTPNHILVVYDKNKNQYVEIEAEALKEYVKNNPESYIPSNGNSTINESETYSYDINTLLVTSDKSSGMLLQSYDEETIVKIVTKQRLSGSSSLILEKEGQKGTIYQTLIGKAPLNKDGFKLIFEDIFTEDTYEDVWCVTVPTHYIFVKRNNSIYVSSQCHSINAKRLGISRTDAKSFSYACIPVDNTEVLTANGWKYYSELQIDDSLFSYNTDLDIIEKDNINDIIYFEDKPIVSLSNDSVTLESTEDHRWFGIKDNTQDLSNDFFTTKQISHQSSILISAPYSQEFEILPTLLPMETETRYLSCEGFKKELLQARPTFCLNTNNSTFIIRQNKTLITITGNCMYGASYKKLAKMLAISEKEGERLYDLYWDGVPALKELRDKVEKFWESTGKKYILSIDKRKLFVRSKHSLINLLFQSTGSLIMKYGNIEVAKRLDDLGLLGDPFYDERDAKKIFSMIIYHDEAQYSVHPDLISIKKYKTEEEAKANLIVHNNGVSHVGDEFWITEENILSKTLDESIQLVCDNFKIKVPIGIEYQVGADWRIMSLIEKPILSFYK